MLLSPHSKAVLSTKLLRRSLLNLECYCQFQSVSVLLPKTQVFISILEKNALGHNKSLLLFHFRRGFSRRATICSVCTSGECRITFTSRGRPFTSVVNMQAHSENHTDITEYLTFRKLWYYGKILEWETWIFCRLKVSRARFSAFWGSDMMPAQDLPPSQTPSQVSSTWNTFYYAFTHLGKILFYLVVKPC